MRRSLEGFVTLRLNAEGDGEAAADRLVIHGYPTTVFLDGAGEEVDRIVGYLPPEEFLGELRRIRSGDTFAACLRQLDLDPGNPEILERAARGFLDRSEPLEVIHRVTAFSSANGEAGPSCANLLLQARAALSRRLFRQAVSAVLWDEGEVPEVPQEAQLAHLEALLADESLEEEAAEVVGPRFREAMHLDVGEQLAVAPLSELTGDDLFAAADVAFSGGHYDTAAELWLRWYREDEAARDTQALNEAAWNLYLARRELDAAVEMARRAYGADGSPSVADTLARLLYVTGSAEEAIDLQSRAASEVEGPAAEDYRSVVERMRAGEELEDRPAFDSFPRLPEPTAAEPGEGEEAAAA